MSLGPGHVEAVTQAADKIHAAAVMLSNPTVPATASNTGNSTINVNAGGWGIAVACGAVLLALVAVVLQGQRISDMHAVIQAERLDRAAMERYQDAENKAIRSYIINGRLEPMRPKPESSK